MARSCRPRSRRAGSPPRPPTQVIPRASHACAPPGGKTAHLLELAELDLLALDSDPLRLARVQETLNRLHLHAQLKAGDARRPADWWDGRPFDAILLDAPCTASGIVRRHPDAGPAADRATTSEKLTAIRETWSIALTFLLVLVASIPLILGVVAISAKEMVLGAIGVAIGAVLLLVIALISSALHAIIVSALYRFAIEGTAPSQFDNGLLENAFARK